MSYVSSSLGPGEEIVFEASIHWIVYLKPVLLMLVGIALGIIFLPGWLIALVGLVWFLATWFIVHTNELAVTTRKVVAKWGFIARDTIEQRLDKVDTIAVDQTFWGRVLNYGNVTVHGTGLNNIRPIRMIADPITFRRKVEQAIDSRVEHQAPATAADPNSMTNKDTA